MRIVPIGLAGSCLALAVPLAAQERPAEAPQSTAPTDAGAAPGAYVAWQAPGAGPAFAPRSDGASTIAQLTALVEQQRGYIAALEKHIAALDAYIASLRGGRH